MGVNHWDERWAAHLMALVASQEHEADQAGFTEDELAAALTAIVVSASRPACRRNDGSRPKSPAQEHVASSNRTVTEDAQIYHHELSRGQRCSETTPEDGSHLVNIRHHDNMLE